MSISETTLLKSLSSYILDIKPFHSKLRHVSSEIRFSDEMLISAKDSHKMSIGFQNIWTKNDSGGWKLQDISDGDRKVYEIPAVFVPRFSLNDRIGQNQEPGNDPSTKNLIDVNGDGFQDDSYPWQNGFSFSHQIGSDQSSINIDDYEIEYDITGIVAVVNDATNIFRATVTYDTIISYNRINLFGVDVSTPIILNNNVSLSYINQSNTNRTIIRIADIVKDITVSSSDVEEYNLLVSGGNRFDPVYESIFFKRIHLAAPAYNVIIVNNTGRYQVPFHTGSRVYVNGVNKIYGTHYIVDKSRGFIQFTAGNHPQPDDKIDINYFKSDRFFISINQPFEFNVFHDHTYDNTRYDLLNYDELESLPPISDSDKFIIRIDYNNPQRYTSEFHNVSLGVDKGLLANVTINPINSPTAVWEITAIGPTIFSVSLVGSQHSEIAYFGRRFDNGKISFIITNTWSDYYIIEEQNSYQLLSLDNSEHLLNLDISEASRLLSINPYGFIQKTNINDGIKYEFVFNEKNKVGTYIEFRIEQNDQYNTIINTSFNESVRFADSIRYSDNIQFSCPVNKGYTISGYDHIHYDTNGYAIEAAAIIISTIDDGYDNQRYDLYDYDDLVSMNLPFVYYDGTSLLVNIIPIVATSIISEKVAIQLSVGSDVTNNGNSITSTPYVQQVCIDSLSENDTLYIQDILYHKLLLIRPVLSDVNVYVYTDDGLLLEDLDYVITKTSIKIETLNGLIDGTRFSIELVNMGNIQFPFLNAKKLRIIFDK